MKGMITTTVLLLSSTLAIPSAASKPSGPCTQEERENFPNTCSMMDLELNVAARRLGAFSDFMGISVPSRQRASIIVVDNEKGRHDHLHVPDLNEKNEQENHPVEIMSQLRQLKHVRRAALHADETTSTPTQSPRPVVMVHGLGDSCFNEGFSNFTEQVGSYLNTYAVCIPTGDTREEDVYNSWFLNMDASVEVFAEKIRNDPKLADGFDMIAHSQGNTLARGYIIKYADVYPTVYTYMSLAGVNAGVGAVPYCMPDHQGEFSDVCGMLEELSTKLAYTTFFQEHVYPANYWRDPDMTHSEEYKEFSQLAQWSNEGTATPYNQDYFDNFQIPVQYVWVLSLYDHVVWPVIGEHWGGMAATDPYAQPIPMEATEVYQRDLFGLKTAHESGKFSFEAYDGTHSGWSDEDLYGWLDEYF
eukprot:CAMPEP_0196806990 /NCGR_PEP_ID=MMETSP1362-20130617/6928_1 /TAXON_ID=163516 /ORGANISM="Leptocylindrus danicus, Strain CCMP1856" /LENGTH=415 /DNA_ID=CAMNT_0042180709 /DNA_START=61 /DNA_END=1308 /DNA_ORIENTATION=-